MVGLWLVGALAMELQKVRSLSAGPGKGGAGGPVQETFAVRPRERNPLEEGPLETDVGWSNALVVGWTGARSGPSVGGLLEDTCARRLAS